MTLVKDVRGTVVMAVETSAVGPCSRRENRLNCKYSVGKGLGDQGATVGGKLQRGDIGNKV